MPNSARNRTNVELKPGKLDLDRPGGGARNRTNVELKLADAIDDSKLTPTRNRTNVELKPPYRDGKYTRNRPHP